MCEPTEKDTSVSRRTIVRGLLLTAGATQVSALAGGSGPTGSTASSVIQSWPQVSQEVAMKIMAKYGPPQEFTVSMLIWHNNGVWKRTIVNRDTIPHRFPVPHPDMLEQFVDYRVPLERYDDLAHYDGSVIVERTKGEISARCDKEEMNMLALNLAHDISTGRRTWQDARDFYAKTAMAFMGGEKAPYTQSLMFKAPKGTTADPDQPANM